MDDSTRLGPSQPCSTPDANPLPADPDPLHSADLDDQDYLLGERCALAYMQADALHYRAMTLLAEFDARSGFETFGFSSAACWLAWRIGITPGAARERVRTARALTQLPRISSALENGEVSYAKVRALTRVATESSEPELLAYAQSCSAARLEQVVRGWKTMDREGELTAENRRHRARRLSVVQDEDGMFVVRGRLTPEVGLLLKRAIDAAGDALFKQEGEDWTETEPEQRRADALGLLAERALTAGFGGGGRGAEGGSSAEGGDSATGGDSAGGGDETGAAPEVISGATAERYQVVLHVSAETLRQGGESGQSELDDGTRVSAETSRRLCCDGSVVRMEHGSGRDAGSEAETGTGTGTGTGTDSGVTTDLTKRPIVGVGRKTRTVPPSVRRAVEARDRGCRYPGCGGRYTDVHHVKHWADGGRTDLKNLVLLCRRHHRAVHEGGIGVIVDAHGKAVFLNPKGRPIGGTAPRRGLKKGVRSATPINPQDFAQRPTWRSGAARHADHHVPYDLWAQAQKAVEREAE